MLLYLIFFVALAVASAFGPTYLLLRRTSYAPYSILLSVVSFQPLLIICVSLLGYRLPVPLRPEFVFVPVLAGIGLTVFVGFRFRSEIVGHIRDAWKSSLLIFGLTLASMVLATPLLLHSTSLAYIDWWNGEMINYAYFAHGFLGLLGDRNYLPSFEQSESLRYGAELFLAAMSVLTAKAPLMLIEIVSAMHKSSAIIAFAVSCDLLRRERGFRSGAVVAACVGFAFTTILALNHQLAFLASQAVTGSVILISLGLLGDGLRMRSGQIFLAIHVLFIVISYSEALPFLAAAGAIAFVEAIWKRRLDVPVAICWIFGLGVLVNPILTVERFSYLYRLRAVMAGFNVLGNPKDDLESYLAAALGLRYPFLNVASPPHLVVWTGVVLGLVVIVCAFFVATYRLRTFLFLGISFLLLVMHFNLSGTIQPGGSEFYKTYKVIAALNFYIFFALAILLDALFRFRTWYGFRRVAQVSLLAAAGVFIFGNAFISVRAAIAIRQVPTVYSEVDVQRALTSTDHGGRPVLFLISDGSAGFWDLMANYLGVPRQLLDRNQAEIIYHNHSPVVTESTIFPSHIDQLRRPELECSFAGKIIIARIGSYSPGPQAVDVRGIVAALAPHLWLKENRLIFDTSAFRVIDGELMNNAVAGSGADGLPNQPPSVVTVLPNSGKGYEGLLSFVYTDPNGEADIAQSLIVINTGLKTTDGCYISYTRATNQLGLVLDGDQTWDAGTLGSNKELENRNCMVDLAHSSVSGSGEELNLRVALKFKPQFAGHKLIHTSVADEGKLTTGWKEVGSWDVPRVVKGALVDNAIPGSGADGLPNQPPSVVTVLPNSGKGYEGLLSFVYTDPNGEADIVQSLVLINSGLNTVNGCYISYNRASNQLGLMLDGDQTWDAGTLGSNKELENRNCMVDLAHSSVSGSGKELNLRVALKFKPQFAGHKLIHTSVADEGKLTTGWKEVGGWDVPRVVRGALVDNALPGSGADGLPNQPPSVVNVLPNSGRGYEVVLSFAYADPNGEADIVQSLVLINSGLNTAGGCYISYTRVTNQLGLMLDGDQAWDAGTLGSNKELENRNCVVDLAHSSVSGTGKELSLRVALKFKPQFAGHKLIHTTVADDGKLTTGWKEVGSWDIP